MAAETEAEARRLLKTREHWRVGFEKGLRTPLVSPDDAEAAHAAYTDMDCAPVESPRRKAMVGTASQVAARLRELAAKFALDEIVINTWTHDAAARHRSYELLANEFGLTRAS